MPIYRLQLDNGDEHTLQAARVVTDGAAIHFQNPQQGRWQPVMSVPANQVRNLLRRVNETNGWRWIRARASGEHELTQRS